MSASQRRPSGRREALSAPVIVRAAIEILDEHGEDALTFRLLATHLSTGAGAIYHHVANKDELLEAAAAELVAGIESIAGAAGAGEAEDAAPSAPAASDADVRTLVLDVFDLIEAHPWLGSQLARAPWQTAVIHVFEAIGQGLVVAGVPERSLFDVASALVQYLMGAAGQQAASARIPRDVGRTEFLTAIAGNWTARAGRGERRFALAMAAQLADHDDRLQFAAGLDLILAGAAAIPRA
jgi:AcrR family transcriptional regulator